MKCSAILLLIAFAVTPIQAQEPQDGVSADLVNRVFGRLTRPTGGDDIVRINLRGFPVALKRLDDRPGVLIQASFDGSVSGGSIKRFHEQQVLVAQVRSQGNNKIYLQAVLEGLTQARLRTFLLSFGHDVREFAPLVQSALAGGISSDDASATKRAVPPRGRAAGLPLDFLSQDQKAFEVKFPTNDSDWETKWKIEWDMESIGSARKAGMSFPKNRDDDTLVLFKIKRAFFKPGKKAPWVQVLQDAHPSELYVPYFFRDTRFFDLRDAGNFVTLDPAEGGPRGDTLGKDRHVMAEIRDRGVAYKSEKVTRRAEELTLWANFHAGNYTYLLEFGFMDDGTVAFRHAPTGYNLPSAHFVPHMHNCCWRLGVNLALEGQKAFNTVAVAKWPGNTPHVPNEALESPTFGVEPIRTEGFCDWEAKEFTKIRVTNPKVVLNGSAGANAQPISYDLVPVVTGIARHRERADESFCAHDFWITRADAPIRQYIQLGDYFREGPARTLDGNGVVLWHMSSALHVPRSEDGILKGSALENGQALATWTTVELRPRNLFGATPIYRTVP